MILLGIIAMVFVSKRVGGGSAKYFIRQQRSIGNTEGYIQEMMNGQKVIKVFNHEEEAIEEVLIKSMKNCTRIVLKLMLMPIL